METKQMEDWVLNLCKKENWELNPATDMNKVIEELGEVSREIRRFHEGRQRPDEDDAINKQEIVKEIASEIGDVLFPLIKIANFYGLSIEDCFTIHKDKMEARYGIEQNNE
jgi:NTP pyrophosphatase (non-canonical NTP hydrolase)